MILSEAATRPPPAGAGRCGGAARRNVMSLGANQAQLQAPSVHNVCVELPPERARPGYCCRLRRCIYGTRGAPHKWECFAVVALETLGFRRVRRCGVLFNHPVNDSTGLMRGGDVVFFGMDADLGLGCTEVGR